MNNDEKAFSDAQIEILDFIEQELLEIVNNTHRRPIKSAGIEILAAWKSAYGAAEITKRRKRLMK